ncbi:MAG TPA: hypothetical protein VI386_01965 [Candidatus Sulfotelmatobacter sp.]
MGTDAKQFIFRYDGNDGNKESDEVKVDMAGEIPVPEKGSVLCRKGAEWRVMQILREDNVRDPDCVPKYRVFLSSMVG